MTQMKSGRPDFNKAKTIYAEEGKGTIGILKNGILHMDRVYETHHFRKQPGWGIDKKAMDNHIHEIRAIVIHCKRIVDDIPTEQLLTYTIDFEKDIYGRGNKELIFNVIDFSGHGAQYLIPDSRWDVQMQTPLPKEQKVELPVAPPQRDLPKAEHISYESFNPMNNPIIDDSYVKIKPQNVKLPPETPTFTFTEIYPFLKKGYAFYDSRLGEGFYIQYEGNTLKVKHEVFPFDMPHALDTMNLDASTYSLKMKNT